MQVQKQKQRTMPSLPRSFIYSVAFMTLYLVVFGSLDVLIGNAYSSPSFQALQGMVITVALIASIGFSWVGFGKRHLRECISSPPRSLQRRLSIWLPLLFSMAMLSQFVGTLILNYNAAHQIFVFPSWGNAAILVAYPFLALGVLGLPTRSMPGVGRLRILFDSMLVIMALLTFSWYFLLGPSMLGEGGGSLLAIVTHLAYPSFDLLLISCLILFTTYTTSASGRLTISLLCAALAMFVLADSVWQYLALHHSFLLTWVSLGWVLANFLIALAVQTMRWSPLSSEISPRLSTQEKPTPIVLLLLPYVLIPAVFGLDLYVWGTNNDKVLALGTYVCSLLLLVLILCKQIFAIREIHWLNRGLWQTQRVLHEKNEALEKANARLEALATTDPLTELPNHRALSTYLESETTRSQRYGHPLSILFFDGDHFKRVNDTYGHHVGDAVLQELGSRVRSQLRGEDIVGRYGGEEFLVLLPETDLTQACQTAERVRKAIAEQPLATSLVKDGVPMTVSLGVASFPVDSTTVSEVVEKADQAMYWAKRLGRNQVRTAQEAEHLNRNQALAATISNLERRTDPTRDGLSIEQVMRTHQLNTIQSLLWLLDMRDQNISKHSHQVSDLAGAIALELGATTEEVFATTTAALLHDLGKIALPDRLLTKVEPLTHTEWALIQQHPALGAQILEVSPFLHHLMPDVRHHHENWDGTGYPDELAGEAIPQAARIIRVAEAYQAMISDLPYQRHRSEREACDELKDCAGTLFDPFVVRATLQVLLRQAKQVEAVDTASMRS